MSGPNQDAVLLGCKNCGPKFAGLFTPAERKKKYDSTRRCMACVRNDNKRNAHARCPLNRRMEETTNEC
jgi:hypothetical protein